LWLWTNEEVHGLVDGSKGLGRRRTSTKKGLESAAAVEIEEASPSEHACDAESLVR